MSFERTKLLEFCASGNGWPVPCICHSAEPGMALQAVPTPGPAVCLFVRPSLPKSKNGYHLQNDWGACEAVALSAASCSAFPGHEVPREGVTARKGLCRQLLRAHYHRRG